MLHRFKQLAEVGYCLDFEEYLSTSRKELIIFSIDDVKSRYVPITQNCPKEIIESVNKNFISSKAGYAVDAHSIFQSPFICDILLVSSDFVGNESSEIDTILIHELAHWIINARLSAPKLSGDEITLGDNIFKRTDHQNIAMTQHTNTFCQLLAHGCINYNKKYSAFPTPQECIESAMRFDIDLNLG